MKTFKKGITILVYLLIVQTESCAKNPFKEVTYKKNDYIPVQVEVKKPEISPVVLPENKTIYAIIITNTGNLVMELFYQDAPKTVQNFIDLAQGEKEFSDSNGTKLKKPFYNGLKFHRVIEGFMAQGGCPKGDGTGGPGYKFEDEINAVSLGLNKIKAKDAPYYTTQLQKMVLKELKINNQTELNEKMDEANNALKTASELPVIEVLFRSGYRYNEVVKSHQAVKGSLAMANSGPDTNGSQFFINQVDTPHLNGLHTVFGQLVSGQDVLDRIIAKGNGNTVIQRISIIDKRK